MTTTVIIKYSVPLTEVDNKFHANPEILAAFRTRAFQMADEYKTDGLRTEIDDYSNGRIFADSQAAKEWEEFVRSACATYDIPLDSITFYESTP